MKSSKGNTETVSCLNAEVSFSLCFNTLTLKIKIVELANSKEPNGVAYSAALSGSTLFFLFTLNFQNDIAWRKPSLKFFRCTCAF